MSKLNVHPAPNRLGQMTPGFLVVPYNPVSKGRVEYRPHIGEFIGASLITPYNPIRDRVMSPNIMRPIAASGPVEGGNGIAGCGCKQCEDGLGNISLGEAFGTINPGYLAAGILGLYIVMRLMKK